MIFGKPRKQVLSEQVERTLKEAEHNHGLDMDRKFEIVIALIEGTATPKDRQDLATFKLIRKNKASIQTKIEKGEITSLSRTIIRGSNK